MRFSSAIAAPSPPARASEPNAGARPWTYRLMIPAALAAVVFVAYYRRWLQFGFYGDDHAFFGNAINRDWAGELDWVRFCLTTWPQGRPLGAGLNEGLIPFLAFKLGGVPALHLGGFAILTANTLLMYRFLSRSCSAAAAFSGAALYAMSPAATVQLSLGYAYLYGISMLVGLLACHAALHDRLLLFGICVAAAFTMVEPVVVFSLLAPPLLSLHRRDGWRSRTLRLAAVWSAVVLILLVVRRIMGDPWGEERVGAIAASPLTTLRHGLESAARGSLTYVDLVAERLLLPWKELDGTLVLALGLCGLLAFASLTWLEGNASRPGASAQGPRPTAHPVILLIAGAVLMAAVYLTYFRLPWYPGTARRGFLSGVHMVPAACAAVFAAGLVEGLLALVPRPRRRAALLAPALLLALLAAFGQLVQRDYAASWRFQKDFWRAYRHLCRDATEGTYVLVLDRNLAHPRFIDLFSWGTEILPGTLFLYRGAPLSMDNIAAAAAQVDDPAHNGPAALIRHPPVVIFTGPELTGTIRRDGTGYRWKPTGYFMLPKSKEEQPQNGNVIVLEKEADSGWRRIEGAVPVDGGTLTLRPAIGDLLDHLALAPLGRVFGL
jgi:hypothetical protein